MCANSDHHFYCQYLQQVQITPADYKKYQSRPQVLVARFIKSQLGTWNIHGTKCCVCGNCLYKHEWRGHYRWMYFVLEMVRNLSYYTVCASIHSEWWSISLFKRWVIEIVIEIGIPELHLDLELPVWGWSGRGGDFHFQALPQHRLL